MEQISNNFRLISRQSLDWHVQLLHTAMLALAVLLAQVLPMQAAQSDGGWMEICGGDEGSYFVQLEDGSSGQEHGCTHCSACLLATSTATTIPPKIDNLILQLKLIDVPLAVQLTPVTSHPEQYWSACRGPPLEGTEKSMIHHGSVCGFVSQRYTGKPQLRINGGLPWS